MNSENHVNVAIIGAGPSGIGAALGLAKNGVQSILLIDRNSVIGGIPALYKKKTTGVRTIINWLRGRVVFGEEYVAWLQKKLAETDVKIWLKSKVVSIDAAHKQLTLVNPDKGKISITADAIILACGAREITPIEIGWLEGARTGRMFFSRSLLELMDQHERLPMKRPVIIGSDLNAYAIATKLKTMGADKCTIVDVNNSPKSSVLSRMYFSKWCIPKFQGGIKSVCSVGNGAASSVILDNGKTISCDGIVLSGDLIPNSELALLANFDVEIPSRKPVIAANYQLSHNGWFATGNILGGFHGAEWCYLNGKKVAKAVAANLRK